MADVKSDLGERGMSMGKSRQNELDRRGWESMGDLGSRATRWQ